MIEKEVSSFKKLLEHKEILKQEGFDVLPYDDPERYCFGICYLEKNMDQMHPPSVRYYLFGSDINVEHHDINSKEEFAKFFDKNKDNKFLVSCDNPKTLRLGWAVYDHNTHTSHVYRVRITLAKELHSFGEFVLKKHRLIPDNY